MGIGLTAALTKIMAEASEAATEKSTVRMLLIDTVIVVVSLFPFFELVIELTPYIAGGVPI